MGEAKSMHTQNTVGGWGSCSGGLRDRANKQHELTIKQTSSSSSSRDVF